jgi:hypothetical protein
VDESLPGPLKKLNAFFGSPIGLMIGGFCLTTLCGAIISARFADSSWRKDKRYELFKAHLAKHEALLSDVTTIVGARTYRMQRVVWATDAEAGAAPETWQLDAEKKNNLQSFWDDYYKTVIDWNLNYRNYAARIRLLAGNEVAEQFFAPGQSGARLSKSDTVCGTFEDAHKLVSELRKAARNGPIDRQKHDEAQRKVDELYDKVDAFVLKLYTVLGDKEKSEDPLASRNRHKTNSIPSQ